MLAVLKSYPWPGNIREMRNEVRRAVLFCRDGLLTPDLFSESVITEARQRLEQGDTGAVSAGLAGHVAQTEQDTIEQMLRMQNFNRAATARALGISRVTLYNKIRKYRIQIDDDKAAE
jgi:DNA-binding NtrC family response regulator